MAPHLSSLLNRELGQLRNGLFWEKFIVISKRFDTVIPPWIPSFWGLSVVPRKTWEPKVSFSSYFTPSLYFNSYSAFPSTYGKSILAKRIKLTFSLQRMRRQVTRLKKLKQKKRNQANLWLSVNRSRWCCNSTMWPTLLKMLCPPQLKSMIHNTLLCLNCIIYGSKFSLASFLSDVSGKIRHVFFWLVDKGRLFHFARILLDSGNCAPTLPNPTLTPTSH